MYSYMHCSPVNQILHIVTFKLATLLTTSWRYLFVESLLHSFIYIQEFPNDLLDVVHVDPNNESELLQHSEVERRKKYFDMLEDMIAKGQQHPLAQLSKSCLNNDPTLRPTAEEIVTALEEMEEEIEGRYGELSKLDAVRQVVTMKALLVKDHELKDRANEIWSKSEQIKQLQKNMEDAQKVILVNVTVYTNMYFIL